MAVPHRYLYTENSEIHLIMVELDQNLDQLQAFSDEGMSLLFQNDNKKNYSFYFPVVSIIVQLNAIELVESLH